MREMSEPTAIEIGNNIPGIKRHKNQKSHYFLCVQQGHNDIFKNAKYVSMEEDINNPGFYIDSNAEEVELGLVQNVACKYTIPALERNKVLKMLQINSISRCSLFEETEDNRLSDCWNILLTNEDV